MKIQFWYSDIFPNTNIKNSIEKLDNAILFKNIDTDIIDTTKLNFLVFQLETKWTNSENPDMVYTHSNQFIELLIKLQDKSFYFIADNTGEAELWVDTLSLNFYNILSKNKIDFNKLIIANNDISKIGIHKTKYNNFILNTCFFPNFFLSTYNELSSYITDINNEVMPDKEFLCLNRRMTNEKYKIIEELYNRKLLNDTRFTWVANYTNKNLLNKNLIEELNIDVDNFKSIQLEDDIVYGNKTIEEKYLYTINPKWYYKSKVNIIVETMLYKNAIHLTEKIWKAIYLGIPFVIYSPSKYYLKTLRDMGLKTFNSVINEDYDNMSGEDKIKQIIDSAIELSNVYNTQTVLDICKFNQQLYFNSEYRKQMCKTLFLDKLYDIENAINTKTLI
jgi:hypothetical protein